MATRQKRQSPARGRKSRHPDRTSRREKELQRQIDEKMKEIDELNAALSKAKSDAKDADAENVKWQETVDILEEKQQALHSAIKRQAGAIEIFEANERASGKRFQLLLSESIQLRAANKKLLVAQEKIATEVRLQMNQLLALHPDDTDTDTTEQPLREKDVKKPAAADVDSSSDSESEKVGRAPAARAPERKEAMAPPEATQTTEEPPVDDRSLSAETLPMSSRMSPADVSMPEPSTTQPISFQPSAPLARDGQEAMSAAVE